MQAATTGVGSAQLPSFGVPEIDAQHLALDAALVELAAAARAGEQRTGALYDAILGQVGEHFASEERLMEAIGYAELREHREAHAACVADAVQLASELHRVGLVPGVVERLCGLREWVWNHVAGKDASMLLAVRRSRGG